MLYQYIKTAGVTRLAVIGLAKHAGKTTALNTIIEDANRTGVSLSVQSIGVDGERYDVLIGVQKPAIAVPTGTLLATAADALRQGSAGLELLETTGIPSALGELCIARVLDPGSVLLAGVRQVAHARFLLERFAQWGAHLHLIDGAFDRMASATAELADGIVLCTGAGVGRTIQDVGRETKHALAKLQMQVAALPWEKELIALARETGRMAIGGAHEPARILSGTNPIVHHPKTNPSWSNELSAIALPGALTDRTLSVLEEMFETVIIKDGTHMMVSSEAWKRFACKGGRILAERRIRVLAVTINPYSPEAYSLPRKALIEEVRLVADRVPVMDCMQPDL